MIDARLARPEDRPHLVTLLTAMDIHYQPRLPAHTPARVAAMLDRIDGDRAYGTRFALGFDGAEAVGIACFALLHPGHQLGGLLFLKDLFVPQTARNRGAGTALMRFLARHAVETGCKRIDFTTETEDALRLYRRLGAKTEPKTFLRIEGEALSRLCG
jgi:GNAT superfamily N-acetyltransferase